MPVNEASRLSSEERARLPETDEQASDERKAGTESERVERDADRDADRDQGLAELERAAEGIRPSWHGAEAMASRPLPPPAPLPRFESFVIEAPARQYSADSTVRTAALLPERLAHLIDRVPVAATKHWLRARPRVALAIAAAVLGLLTIALWPASEPEPLALKEGASQVARHVSPPPLPALPAREEPAAPAPVPAAGATEGSSSTASDGRPSSALAAPTPDPARSAKRSEKRAPRAVPKNAPKAAAPKARELTKPSIAARPGAAKPVKASVPAR